MTSLDRAFIKAFAEAPPAAPDAESPAAPLTSSTVNEAEAAPSAAAETGADEELPQLDLELPLAPLSSFARAQPVEDSFRPLLEIDRAAFPEACGQLLGHASGDWDRLAEQLVEQMGQGHKCVATAGIARGDGSTTVLLALAQRVAARGLRPVVVDADPANPVLARTCGISAQTGWNDLVDSELPLGEALITAVEDGVTLMPWRGESQSLATLSEAVRTGSIFGTLREHFDLVLLDLMPLGNPANLADAAALARAIHLDAVYLIHNVRTTSRQRQAAVCADLRQTGLPLAAVIENFVSPASPGGAAPIAPPAPAGA